MKNLLLIAISICYLAKVSTKTTDNLVKRQNIPYHSPFTSNTVFFPYALAVTKDSALSNLYNNMKNSRYSSSHNFLFSHLKPVRKTLDKPEQAETPESQKELERDDIYGSIIGSMEKRGTEDRHMCTEICNHCVQVATRRVSILCNMECNIGGAAFEVCFTYWNIRSELTELRQRFQ